jgi:small conductance mechanosensitive channel
VGIITDILESPVGRTLVVCLILVLTAVIARWVDRRVSASVQRSARRRTFSAASDLERTKRAHTAASLVASFGRYAIVGIGIVTALAVGTHGAFAAGTFGGVVVSGTVLVVVIAFILQRVLIDMIAGALLLFEGHLAVGDFVKTSQFDGISGIVERVGLRATTLRSFNGDQHVVMNAALNGFTRVRSGFCDFEIELFTVNDADATEMVEQVCERVRRYEQNFFLRGPDVLSVGPIEDRDVQHVRLRAIVPPTMEWLCERVLPSQLAAELGDLLLGEVQVFNLDEASFSQYRAAVVLPEQLARPARDTRQMEDRLTARAYDDGGGSSRLTGRSTRRRAFRGPS